MTPRVRQYAEEIAFWHGVPVSAVLGRSRNRAVCVARGDLMRRLRDSGFSTPQIGHWLNRDHSTVVYWVAKLSTYQDIENTVNSNITVDGCDPRAGVTPPLVGIDYSMKHNKSCSVCGTPIRKSKSGMCRRHVALSFTKDEAWMARRTQALVIAICRPDELERRRKLLAHYSRERLSWCPLEYRQEYRRLSRVHGVSADEARQMIDDLIRRDAAEYARTGELQQAKRAA